VIVLHAAIVEGQFFLWGERPHESNGVEKPLRQRRSKGNVENPLPSPYDAGIEGIVAALEEAGLRLAPRKRHADCLRGWFPTVGGRVVPSTPLIADLPDSIAVAPLACWTVTAVRLAPDQIIELLCSCIEKPTLALGVIVGEDLGFWLKALRFAGSLVARQKFLPGITRENGAYSARWTPVIHGPDGECLRNLARAMPAVSRALTRPNGHPVSPSEGPSAPPPISVASHFVEEIVDQLIRSSDGATSPGERKVRPADLESLHDQWLYALRRGEGRLEGEAAELARFADQVREWQRPVSISLTSPFRLCFRLEEPDETQEKKRKALRGWYVRYLLQSHEDPSLIIPAEEAWMAEDPGKGSRGKKKAPLLSLREFDAREYLLLSLGQAAGVCPRIEKSLGKSAPGGYELDAGGALEFLSQKALALEQSGFGVILPAWWTGKGSKVALTARAVVRPPKMRPTSGLSLHEIVQFDWEVALGGEKLSLAELRELARLKAPLVRLRGQWVQVNGEEIRAALELWKERGGSEATLQDIVQMSLGGGRAPGDLPLEGVRATGWIGRLLAGLEGRTAFETIALPKAFQGELRPYQVRGYSWLAFLRRWGLGACLADDMGLGKTIQTLALIQRDWQQGIRRPVLIICPTTVVSNWQKEAARFTPDLPVMVHHGVGRAKGREFQKAAGKQAMVISSYALLHRDAETLRGVPWAGMVLDEAQNIKNPETKQARAARGLPAEYRIALTGTPVENHVGDLWSIMELLNPGLLGSQTEFRRNFFIPIQAARNQQATEQLRRRTGPFILRRLKTDKSVIADLPEKQEMKVFCTLTREQASLYEAVVKESLKALAPSEGIQRKGIVLATLSKLKQVCNHPAQFLGDNSPTPGRSGKLARLTEMVEEMLAVGDRMLIFSQFAEMGEILRRQFQATFGREVLFLHGAVPKEKRDHMIKRFQEEEGPHIFILSLKAGGTGLNLTRASHVVHFDRWWNPAVENQATDRAFRIGQTKNVQVHKFLCVGTLEEKIDEMIERKKEIAEKVVGTGEGWLTKLSTAELKDLFSLRPGAVGD
jgi:superfamily II DNA or RNA helicase